MTDKIVDRRRGVIAGVICLSVLGLSLLMDAWLYWSLSGQHFTGEDVQVLVIGMGLILAASVFFGYAMGKRSKLLIAFAGVGIGAVIAARVVWAFLP